MSDEPGVAGEQQGDLVRRLRAVVEAKDAEIGVLRGELAAAHSSLDDPRNRRPEVMSRGDTDTCSLSGPAS